MTRYFENNHRLLLNDPKFEEVLKNHPELAWKVAKDAGTVDNEKLERLVKGNPELALSMAKHDRARSAKR